MFVRTAHKCRAYPDQAQASVLNRTFGCVRVVWNRTLAWRHQRYHAEKAGTNLPQANAYLTAMKKTGTGLAWLNEVSSVPLQQAIRHQQVAYTAFFAKRARYPRFKSRNGRQAAEYIAARTDFLHRTSTSLVRDHDVIVLEDLPVKNMVRNRKLAKAISDCGWGTFRVMIEYKAARYGRRVITVDRWHPSSKTCSACGFRLADLSLKTRTWQCPSCGTRHDRDHNAAKNILAAGLAVAGGNPGHACGADVRHPGSSRVQPAVKQEPQGVSPGIPVLQRGE
jgi:IS605 OrfB family transposase